MWKTSIRPVSKGSEEQEAAERKNTTVISLRQRIGGGELEGGRCGQKKIQKKLDFTETTAFCFERLR